VKAILIPRLPHSTPIHVVGAIIAILEYHPTNPIALLGFWINTWHFMVLDYVISVSGDVLLFQPALIAPEQYAQV
jgi:hypothetical protein